MADDPVTFKLAIAEFLEKAGQKRQEAVRNIGVGLLTSVVNKSPVDTGRFRGNWNVAIDDPDSSTTTDVDPDGEPTINRGIDALQVQIIDQDIWITNNLPYAIPLENGHSQQAPNGMVELTVAEFQSIVDESVKGGET